MIFISKGYLQKDAKRLASMKWKWKKSISKRQMKVRNEKGISEHES